MTTVAPDALAVSCDEPGCGAGIGRGCVRENSDSRAPHPSRVAKARLSSDRPRLPAETRDHIAIHGAAIRAAREVTDLLRAHPRLAPDIAAAIRNCPHAVAAMGRALAHGEREGGAVGPNRGQTAQDHAEHAMAHAAVAYGRHEERDAVTGELDATHAMARWALFVEVSR